MQVGAAWGAHLSPPCTWPWWPVVSGCRRLSPWSSLRCSSASDTSPCTSSLKISYMPASWKLWVRKESDRSPANVLLLTVNYCMAHILYFTSYACNLIWNLCFSWSHGRVLFTPSSTIQSTPSASPVRMQLSGRNSSNPAPPRGYSYLWVSLLERMLSRFLKPKLSSEFKTWESWCVWLKCAFACNVSKSLSFDDTKHLLYPPFVSPPTRTYW